MPPTPDIRFPEMDGYTAIPHRYLVPAVILLLLFVGMKKMWHKGGHWKMGLFWDVISGVLFTVIVIILSGIL